MYVIVSILWIKTRNKWSMSEYVIQWAAWTSLQITHHLHTTMVHLQHTHWASGVGWVAISGTEHPDNISTSSVLHHKNQTTNHTPSPNLGSERPSSFVPLTFQSLRKQSCLVVWEVHDGRWRGWSEEVFVDLASVSFLPGQQPLLTFPLIQVVSGLSKVHMHPPWVLLICTGADAHPVAWGNMAGSSQIHQTQPYRYIQHTDKHTAHKLCIQSCELIQSNTIKVYSITNAYILYTTYYHKDHHSTFSTIHNVKIFSSPPHPYSHLQPA